MRLRPVLLVVLLLTGFYFVTTHLASTGTLGPLLSELHPASSATNVATLRGQDGAFDLDVASAAPAFDAEEQQNIAVYKKALPSVVNITATEVRFDFFYGPVPQQGQGSGFILNKDGLILTNNHVIGNAQPGNVEVTLSDKHQYKASVVTVDKVRDLALLKINAPNLVPATLADSSTGLMVGQRAYGIGNPFGLSGTMTRGIISALGHGIVGQQVAHRALAVLHALVICPRGATTCPGCRCWSAASATSCADPVLPPKPAPGWCPPAP